MSYNIDTGLTKGMFEAAFILNTLTTSPATWSPAVKGPYRYVRIRASPQDESLVLRELKVNGYPVPRTPHNKVFTGIAMSNSPISTVSKVVNAIECASICLRQTDSACVTAQFNQAKQSCSLFNGLEHTNDPSNASRTVVFKFAAHFFAN